MVPSLRFTSLIFAVILVVIPLRGGDFTVSKLHYNSGGRDITVLAYSPTDGKKTHPPVFVLYGSLGNLEDAETRAITHHYSQLLAGMGYQVYALHYLSYFHGELPENNEPLTHVIEAKNLSRIEAIVGDGIRDLAPHHDSVAMAGFSFGATLSLDMAATRHDIAAVVDFYGKAYPWIKVRPVTYRTPTIILHGEKDTEAPIENAFELHAFFRQHDIPNVMHIYPGVGHTFNGNPGAPISLDAQKRALAFLGQYYPVVP